MKLPALVGWTVILGAGAIGAWNVFVDYERSPYVSIEHQRAIARIQTYRPYKEFYVLSRDGLGLRIVEIDRSVQNYTPHRPIF